MLLLKSVLRANENILADASENHDPSFMTNVAVEGEKAVKEQQILYNGKTEEERRQERERMQREFEKNDAELPRAPQTESDDMWKGGDEDYQSLCRPHDVDFEVFALDGSKTEGYTISFDNGFLAGDFYEELSDVIIDQFAPQNVQVWGYGDNLLLIVEDGTVVHMQVKENDGEGE